VCLYYVFKHIGNPNIRMSCNVASGTAGTASLQGLRRCCIIGVAPQHFTYYWSTMMAYVAEILPQGLSINKLLPCRCPQHSVKLQPRFSYHHRHCGNIVPTIFEGSLRCFLSLQLLLPYRRSGCSMFDHLHPAWAARLATYGCIKMLSA